MRSFFVSDISILKIINFANFDRKLRRKEHLKNIKTLEKSVLRKTNLKYIKKRKKNSAQSLRKMIASACGFSQTTQYKLENNNTHKTEISIYGLILGQIRILSPLNSTVKFFLTLFF